MFTFTYGVLPSYHAFSTAYCAVMGSEEDVYQVRNCKRVGNVGFDCETLFNAVSYCVAIDEEADLDWASRVLSTLGIEWV